MILSLFAALVPAATLFLEPPVLPASSGIATVGVRVERNFVSVENFSDAPRWIVLSSSGFRSMRALAPYASVEWACSEDCLWNVNLQIADKDAGRLHLSARVSLYAALEYEGQALWFGKSPTCWVESGGDLEPYFDGSQDSGTTPPQCLQVPLPAPGDRTGGDTPPPVDNTPLPPF
jgi:hypothetical protein